MQVTAAPAGVDGLALVCAGAGGHTVGISAFAFVPAVRSFLDGLIVVGGSIGTGGAIRAVELLGADLVYAGTPFIVARESLASDGYRDMVLRASVEDLVLSRAHTGADAWYLRESIVAAGLDPDSLTGKSKVDWRDSQGQLKAWRNTPRRCTLPRSPEAGMAARPHAKPPGARSTVFHGCASLPVAESLPDGLTR